MILATILFYVFSFVLLAAAVGVICSRNPVHAVLLLILCFFSAASLMILLGAEFIAMLLVIVYVGAVAVLFLFVVMMLNVNFAAAREGFQKYLTIGIGLATFLFVEIFSAVYASSLSINKAAGDAAQANNTVELGKILYTDYGYLFQIAGLILLVAMVGAIVLTFRKRDGVRKQDILVQLARNPKETIEIRKVPIGKGVDV
jgi:NADH-quinone oxidoreductase subunit J